MKKVYFLVLIIFLAACSANNEKSDAYGNFEAIKVIVSSQVNGQILEFNLDEGMQLKDGEILGFIDTTALHLQKKQLLSKKKAIHSKISNINAQINVQQQQKKNLLTDKKRLENLFNEGAATQKQMDDIEGAIDLVHSQIEATKTQLHSVYDEINATDARIDLVNDGIKKSIITNPTDGIVLTKIAETGEITAFGKPLYIIANLDQLILKAYISGDQLPDIKLGQEVEVLVDKNKKENQSFTGKITWISDQAEFTPKIIQTKEERVNLVYAIKIQVPNDGTLKIGMPGEVNF